MRINLFVNGISMGVDVVPGTSLLKALRSLGYFGAKHGCESGECGACTVLLDGKPVNTCVLLAAQAEGHEIQTIEAFGQHPQQGWKITPGLHLLQQAFVEYGAIQCGYCTPAMILAASELLERNPSPSEAEVRQALSGVLCRCTGYLKPVQAVLATAERLRGGEGKLDSFHPEGFMPMDSGLPGGETPRLPEMNHFASETQMVAPVQALPKITVTPEARQWTTVGKPEPKVDAVKLAQGKPAFAADFEMRRQPGAVVAGSGSGVNLAGYPSGGLLHRRAIRSNSRTVGYLFFGQQSPFRGRPGGLCGSRNGRDRCARPSID